MLLSMFDLLSSSSSAAPLADSASFGGPSSLLPLFWASVRAACRSRPKRLQLKPSATNASSTCCAWHPYMLSEAAQRAVAHSMNIDINTLVAHPRRQLTVQLAWGAMEQARPQHCSPTCMTSALRPASPPVVSSSAIYVTLIHNTGHLTLS